MTIFERIKELADKQGKSLQKVSEELGFSSNYLYQLKRQTPAADKLALIADYFNVSVDYLLGRENSEKDNFRKNLKELYATQELTGRELAGKLGQSYNDFKSFLSGEKFPDSKNLERIAYYFEVSVNYLLGKKGMENNFSNNLINLRRNVGLTRKQLAEELGVSSRLISELESGKIFPSMASVKKISEYFDVSGEFLLGLPESNELNAFEIMTLQDFIDYSSPRQREVFDEILFAIAQANKISVNEELLIKMRDILFILSDLPLNTDDLEDHRTMRLMD